MEGHEHSDDADDVDRPDSGAASSQPEVFGSLLSELKPAGITNKRTCDQVTTRFGRIGITLHPGHLAKLLHGQTPKIATVVAIGNVWDLEPKNVDRLLAELDSTQTLESLYQSWLPHDRELLFSAWPELGAVDDPRPVAEPVNSFDDQDETEPVEAVEIGESSDVRQSRTRLIIAGLVGLVALVGSAVTVRSYGSANQAEIDPVPQSRGSATAAVGDFLDSLQVVVIWPTMNGSCTGSPVGMRSSDATIASFGSQLSLAEDPRHTAARLGGAVVGPGMLTVQLRNNGLNDMFLEDIRLPVVDSEENPTLDWVIDVGTGCGGVAATQYLRFDLESGSLVRVTGDNEDQTEPVSKFDFVGTRLDPGNSMTFAVEVMSCGALYDWDVMLDMTGPEGAATIPLGETFGPFRSVGNQSQPSEFLVMPDRSSPTGRTLQPGPTSYRNSCRR